MARHLLDVVEGGRFVSADGTVDYETGIDRMRFPIIQLAAASRLSPERVARAMVEGAPAGAREYVRLGIEQGFSEDYNHFSVLLGENAPREVFPRVADFLYRHAVHHTAEPPEPGALTGR